jgi:hypothetical protein
MSGAGVDKNLGPSLSDLTKNPATHRRIKIGRVFLELAGGVR